VERASEKQLQSNGLPDTGGRWSGALVLRVVTALVAIPIVLLFIWLGGWAAFAALLFTVIWSLYELRTMLLHSGYRPVLWLSLALSVIFLVSAMFPRWRLLLLEIDLGVALLGSFPFLFVREKLEGALIDWALTLAFALYLGWPLSLLLLLRGSQISWPPPGGFWWLLLLFLGVWTFDSAAFFTGHFLGRHKLAPRISPGKTWEGVVGGLVCTLILCVVLAGLLLKVPWYLALVLGLALSLAAAVGDLAESLIKRQLQVKDSGQLMPGHGGLLDRIDSLLFAAVVVYLFAQLVAL
jgi:phosphatidate cytidylyltransferase